MINYHANNKIWYKYFSAYNIYENDAVLINNINGSYTNVLGLPIRSILKNLAHLGYMNTSKFNQKIQKDNTRVFYNSLNLFECEDYFES